VTASRPRRALVTDAARGSAVAVITSLARRGWHVIAADHDRFAPGLHSRHAHEHFLYPPPRETPDQFIAALGRAVRERHVDVVVPITDDAIVPLAAANGTLDGCAVALPGARALAATTDKRATIALAESLGIPTPRTAVVETAAEALERAPALGWPVVLKPERSKRYRPGHPLESFAVTYAEDAEALRERMERLEGRGAVLVQEYYPGEGHGVAILAHEGRLLAAFQHRRLREYPLTGGTSAYRESVPLDPVLYAHAARLVAALAWTGPALVEFKLGARGPKLMEINGRVWGSLPLAVKSGIDFPASWLELYRSGPPPAGEPARLDYAVGVRSRDFALELAWILTVLVGRPRYHFEQPPKRRAAFRVACRLLSATEHDVISREDPILSILEVLRAARLGLSELRRRVGRDRSTDVGIARAAIATL
jgi:predicted ATP-grasp superfamily ATP-dependent carboligase